MIRAGLLTLAATSCFILPPASAGSDPCDFAGSGPIYPHAQVLECYESVPFNPADLQNAVEVIGAYRERSSLRGIYDQRVGWRASLQALGTETFPNDYAFQVALVLNHKEFDNGHIRYQRPLSFFSADPDADLNGDGMVNFMDLSILKDGFFLPPGPMGMPGAD